MKYVCPQCGYHGDTIRGYIPTKCWSCGAKLPEHLCRKCGSEIETVKDSTGYAFQRCIECGSLPRRSTQKVKR